MNTNHRITNDSIASWLNSQVENMDHCSYQIIDTAKKVVKAGAYPKSWRKPGIKQWTEIYISIADLSPGAYTMVLYLGKEEMEKLRFTKDRPEK